MERTIHDCQIAAQTSGNVKAGKLTKGPSGTVGRKRLTDITNIQQPPRNSVGDEKSQCSLDTTKEYMEQLKKENMALMKMLADRNKIIELTGNELQKLRINMQKMQQQNLQLAQSNSQMLAELNSGKDRLKVLQHELGCITGLLKAKIFEENEKEKLKSKACLETDNQEKPMPNDDPGESTGEGGNDNKQKPTRRHQSKSVGPSCRQVESMDKAGNRRQCLRRQSARFKSEATESSFDLSETQVEPKDNAENKRPCSRRRSARFKSEENELAEDFSETLVEPKDKAGNKRPCLRRQSARLKSGGTELSEDLSEMQVEPNDKAGTKRPSLRQQSARFKPEETKPSEDSFQTDDANFSVCPPTTDTVLQNSSSPVMKHEDEQGDAGSGESQEFGRSSIARPSRHAAKKVQSYKEIPLNVKMRRPQ